MTLQALAWYRVKETKQFCQVASIISSTDPHVQVKSASENMLAFHFAIIWFTPTDEADIQWTKRAILVEAKKAFGLLREPTEENLLIIVKPKKIANAIPFHSMSVDGTKTVAFPKKAE
jgi:hypothetical protein